MIYPSRATMWHDEALVIVGGGSIYSAHDSGQDYAKYARITTHANGDEFTNGFMLEAGTYTFSVLGYTDTNLGKLDWYIDDVLVVTGEDWYGSSVNNVLKTHASITVTGSGRHVLRGVTNGKNGSSSNYYIELTKYWFTSASDVVSV